MNSENGVDDLRAKLAKWDIPLVGPEYAKK